MIIDELMVKSGDAIPEAWERLKRYVARLGVDAGSGRARVHYYPQKIEVVFDEDAAAFVPRFSVSVSGLKCSVGFGLCNGALPLINGKKINGESDDGKTTGEAPLLDLAYGPSSALRSWVCLRAVVDPATGALVKKEPFSVVHARELPDMRAGGIDDDGKGAGLYPLALVVWESFTQISTVHQIVMHNLNHAFVKPSAGALGVSARGRHYFFAA